MLFLKRSKKIEIKTKFEGLFNFKNKSKYNDSSLPENLHILTLQIEFDNITNTNLIVHLEYSHEKNEDSELSKPIKFDMEQLVNIITTPRSVEELALDANMNLDGLRKRLK